jgi:ferritin-like metal-binding protein YciE
MERMTEMKELLTHELGDLLYAERRFLTSTRHLAREARDPKLRQRIERHVEETEGQIERLADAFEAIGEKPRAERCEAAIGLREEHDSFRKEERPTPEILEAFDLGSGLRVEHYEIASYRSAIAVANALGETACANLLRRSLKEEEEMAGFLERNAPALLGGIVAAGESAMR